MTPAAHCASIQARLLAQFCRDATALWEQFQLEFALAEQGLYADKPAPAGSQVPGPPHG